VEQIKQVQQLEWTYDQTSEPLQVLTASILATAHQTSSEYAGERGKGGWQLVNVHG
jgi:hypothetical protein